MPASSSSASMRLSTPTSSATHARRRRRSRRSSTVITSSASRVSSSGRARAETASCAAASVAEIGGLWYEPTLVEPRSNDSEIVQREVFGPVLTFQTFTSEEEAVALGELDRVRARGDPLHLVEPSEPSGWAGRFALARSGSTAFLVRDLTAPFGGVGVSGHRPRGRRLRARFLLRPEDAADRGGLDPMTVVDPRARPRRRQPRERRLRRALPPRDVRAPPPRGAGVVVRLAATGAATGA